MKIYASRKERSDEYIIRKFEGKDIWFKIKCHNNRPSYYRWIKVNEITSDYDNDYLSETFHDYLEPMRFDAYYIQQSVRDNRFLVWLGYSLDAKQAIRDEICNPGTFCIDDIEVVRPVECFTTEEFIDYILDEYERECEEARDNLSTYDDSDDT